MLCPCDKNNDYSQCCELIHLEKLKVQTPEQLMRSRYSAYVLNNANYIYDTYAKAYQKQQSFHEIKIWAQETTWLNLKIITANDYKNTNNPTVAFEAIYKKDNTFYKMKETSNFIKENNLWRYTDGNNLYFEELPPPKRNDNCVCLSGKKYKKCCSI